MHTVGRDSLPHLKHCTSLKMFNDPLVVHTSGVRLFQIMSPECQTYLDMAFLGHIVACDLRFGLPISVTAH